MKRRDLLALALAGIAHGQRYRTYSQCLPEYLAGLARAAYEKRNAALARIQTPQALRERQGWVRKTFWELVGGMPERTPLNVRTLGSFGRTGYTVEKLVYESRPELYVTANLYIPNGKGPFPGVLFQMGHSEIGKAAEPYQKCCQGLARLGYLVLAFDPMGQGERRYYDKGATTEHNIAGRQMLLLGDTATRMQTWDAVRSLDVLAAHPLVDPKRLASTGQSGGGTTTMFLCAVDERLTAAAVSSGNTENFACAGFNPPGSVDDAEQNFLNSGPVGFDRWDLLWPVAPKPLLVAASAKDFHGTYSPNYLTSGDEEFAKLRRVYFDNPERLRWVDSPVPHALVPNIRVAIYNFFEKWLRGSDRTVEEPEVSPETAEQLWAGKTGNVVRDFGSTTPHRLAQSMRITKTPADLKAFLKVETNNAAPARLGQTRWGNVNIEAIEVQSAPGVFVPAWVYLPPSPPKSMLLVLEPGGRNAGWREDGPYHELAKKGAAVCAFDVRGIGDLAPEIGRGNPAHTRSRAEEDAYAWASMMLGKPMLGQRVTDILAVSSAMRRRGLPLKLAAHGKMAVPALFALALDKEIAAGFVTGAPISYASLLEQETYTEPFANVVPGILRHTDLPELRAALGARLTEGKPWANVLTWYFQ